MAYDKYAYGTYSGRPNYRLGLYVRREATSGNSSKYAWELFAERTSGAASWRNDGALPWEVAINGQRFYGSAAMPFQYTSRVSFGTGVTNYFAHDANGNLTITIEAGHQGGSGFGNAAASEPFTVDRIAMAPGAPGTPVVTELTSSSFRLTSSAAARGNADLSNYQFQVSQNSSHSPAGPSYSTSSGTVRTLSVSSGIGRGNTYYARARAYNSDGWGGYSANVTINIPHTVPDQPVAVSVSGITATGASVNTTDPAYVGTGVLQRETQVSANGFSTIAATSGAVDPVFTTLVRATNYESRFRVLNAIGWSAWSVPTAFSTLTELPSAPVGYSPHDQASTTAYSGLGSVADNGGAALTDVRVHINTTESPVGGIYVTEGAYRDMLLTSLTPGTAYKMRMAVGNPAGFGPYGAWVDLVTKNNVPTAPATGPTVSSITDTGASVAWTAPANLYGSTIFNYVVRVATNKSFGSGLQTFTPAASPQAISGLLPGTKHFVQIWTNTNNGNGSMSDIVEFTTTGTPPTPGSRWKRIPGVGWRTGVHWKKIPGVGWRQCVKWTRVAGVWKMQ
jgi:hypothetical protein